MNAHDLVQAGVVFMCDSPIEFATTKEMADILGFSTNWLMKNIGVVFFEDLHTIKLGHKTRRWCAPLCIDRIANWNDEKSHRQALESYLAKLPCNWVKLRKSSKQREAIIEFIESRINKPYYRIEYK